MHHDLWMIFMGWVMRKGFDAGWNYLKELVQAVALYVLVIQFILFFVASYAQPRPSNIWAHVKP